MLEQKLTLLTLGSGQYKTEGGAEDLEQGHENRYVQFVGS